MSTNILIKDNRYFVVGLLWQTQLKVNKKDYKACGFVYYVKNRNLPLCHGFLAISAQDAPSANRKNKYSLAMLVLSSLEISSNHKNTMICFHFDQELYGYVTFYKGGVLPINGEAVADIETVTSSALDILIEYDIEQIMITDDFLAKDLLVTAKPNLEVFTLAKPASTSNGLSTSEYFFWTNRKYLKQALCRKMIITYTQYCLYSLLLFIFVGVAVLFYNNTQNRINIVPKSGLEQKIQPAINSKYLPAEILVNKCLHGIGIFIQPINGWKLISWYCESLYQGAEYSNQGGYITTLQRKLPMLKTDMISPTSHIVTVKKSMKSTFDNYDLAKNHASSITDGDKVIKVDQLHYYAQNINAKLVWQHESEFSLTTILSPIWLLEHHIINDLLLSKISLKINDDGFLEWNLLGRVS